MQANVEYTLETLFQQLGLDSSEAGINRFVAEHGPLDPTVRLTDAAFWSTGQSSFLSEAIDRDGPWAMPVGELDALLR